MYINCIYFLTNIHWNDKIAFLVSKKKQEPSSRQQPEVNRGPWEPGRGIPSKATWEDELSFTSKMVGYVSSVLQGRLGESWCDYWFLRDVCGGVRKQAWQKASSFWNDKRVFFHAKTSSKQNASKKRWLLRILCLTADSREDSGFDTKWYGY